MKKLFLIAIAAAGMMTAQAQQALEAPSFGSNWSIGIEGGGITPLYDALPSLVICAVASAYMFRSRSLPPSL